MATARLFCETNQPAARGLAVDESLTRWVTAGRGACATASEGAAPLLHLYTFQPSVILGRFQDAQVEVQLDHCRELGVAVNRRLTGGGAILMGRDQLGVALALPPEHPLSQRGLPRLFNVLGPVLAEALNQFAPGAAYRPKNDVEVGGRKVAGLAASEEEGGVSLFHASVLVDFDVALMLEVLRLPVEKLSDKAVQAFEERITTLSQQADRGVEVREVVESVAQALGTAAGVAFAEGPLIDEEEAQIRALVTTRYGTTDWVLGERCACSHHGSAVVKTPGGLVRASVAIAGSAIESALLTGDFFADMADLNRIEAALKWLPANAEAVRAALERERANEALPGVGVEALVEIVMRAAGTDG